MNQHQAPKHKYNNILSFKYNRFIKNIYLEVRRLSRTFFAKYTPPTLKKKKKQEFQVIYLPTLVAGAARNAS